MTSLAALYQAIVDAPTDDAPRRAYAQAVAATDPQRAELIELQLALAQFRRSGLWPPERTEAQVRSDILLDHHGASWVGDVRELVDAWTFRRGFIDEVRLPADRFLAHANELYRRAPILHLTLTGVLPHAAALFASPHLARISSLRLDNNDLGDAEAALLARSPHLAQLAWLDLGDNRIGMPGLEALAASDRLPRLRYVRFENNAIADPTPRHADEYETETPVARALQAKYGPRAWLSPTGHGVWPPPRDAA